MQSFISAVTITPITLCGVCNIPEFRVEDTDMRLMQCHLMNHVSSWFSEFYVMRLIYCHYFILSQSR